MNEKDYTIRAGPGIKWQQVTSHSVISGYSIDNLNTKEPAEAKNPFEELFISVRKVLEQHESCCMDVESERLKVCQAVSDNLHTMFDILKKAPR